MGTKIHADAMFEPVVCIVLMMVALGGCVAMSFLSLFV